MYIIELFFKKKRKKTTFTAEHLPEGDYEACNHLFVPIDSDKQTLACTKCGLIMKNQPAKNFFMN